jgi:hypothetical protein
LALQSFDYERTWLNLFQIRVVCAKLDIYYLCINLDFYFKNINLINIYDECHISPSCFYFWDLRFPGEWKNEWLLLRVSNLSATSWRERNFRNIMAGTLWREHHGGNIMARTSWRERNVRNIMAGTLWREHHGGNMLYFDETMMMIIVLSKHA